HRFLADKVVKRGRAVFAGQHPIGHRLFGWRRRGRQRIAEQAGTVRGRRRGRLLLGIVLGYAGHTVAFSVPFPGALDGHRGGTVNRRRWEAGERPERELTAAASFRT